MGTYGDILANAGLIVYVIIGLFVVLFAWWGYKGLKGKKGKVDTTDLPTKETEDFETLNESIAESKEKQTGDVSYGGLYKCVCFRRIKGLQVADFTTISQPVGELYQFDPSCPIQGNGYIVKEDDQGHIVDYDPRLIKFKIESSPEYAHFSINWDIVKQVFFVPVQWWKSTSVWFAAAMLIIVFVSFLAVLG